MWVYDVTKATYVHAMTRLPDSVVSMIYVESLQRVFVGVANGQLAMYELMDLYKPPMATKILDIAGSMCCRDVPLMCFALSRNGKDLLCGVGHNVIVLQLERDEISPKHQWSVSPENVPHKGLVSNILMDKHGVWTSTKASSRICLWNKRSHKLDGVINCDSLAISDDFEDRGRGMHVVSMLMHNTILWVGTGGGHILLFDTKTTSLLMSMSRHKTAVRCLITSEILQSDGKQISVVLSGGLGFVPRWSSSHETSLRDFGYVLIWESGIQKEAEHLHEYKKRRQEWQSHNVL